MAAGQSQSASLQDTPEDLSNKEGNSNTNNSIKSALRQHLDQPPSGLSLLVAALDAQSTTHNDRRARLELAMDSSNSEASISPSPSTMDGSGGAGGGEGSSRRRPSSDVHKDETYWEKRRRNNDAAKRSREKRRLNDMVMEQRLLELSKENTLLKNELHTNRSGLPSSPVVVTPKIEPALPTATTPLLFTASQPAMFDLGGAPAPKIPNLSLITNHPSGSLSGSLGSNSQHLNLAPASSQHLNLATGQNFNLPPSQLHPSLFASVLQPHPMLQLYQAQIQAALAAQQQQQQQQQQNQSSTTGLLALGNGSAFQPFSSGNGHPEQQQHVSPDSSTVDGGKLTIGVDQSSACLDGKQYLRYKLLERQNRRSSTDSMDMNPIPQPSAHSNNGRPSSSSNNNDRPQSLLGSLLSNRRSSPSVLQSRTERESGLATTSSSSSSAPSLNTDLKQCLSSLAVHLTTAKSNSSDSMASPSSSRGAESTNSSQSQPSPSGVTENGAILNALRSKIGGTEVVTERYVERRKRNNEAAKRCRANRRALFEFRFKRTQQLEQENTLLRDDIEQLTKEVLQLKEQLLMQHQRSARLDAVGRCDAEYNAALPTQAAVQKNKGMLDMTSQAQDIAVDQPVDHSTSPSVDSGHHDSGSDAEDGAKLSIAESA